MQGASAVRATALQNIVCEENMAVTKTLFERIGGEEAVRATVAKLYGKILTDGLLMRFFEGIDVERLRRSQAAFVAHAFGSPDAGSVVNLRRAHQRLVADGLSDQHFDKVAQHLRDAMQELDVPEGEIIEALAIVETTRVEVLNR